MVAHSGLAVTELQNTTLKDGGMGSPITSRFINGGQTMEGSAIGIIKFIADSNANSGELYAKEKGEWI